MENQTFIRRTPPYFHGKYTTELAIASFAIGTIILALHQLFSSNVQIMIFGFFYVIFAGIINGIVFLNLAYHFIMLPNQREEIAIKALILLSNIPIAIFYVYLVINL